MNQSRREKKKKEKENIPRNNLVNDNFTSAIYHVPSMISVLWNMLTRWTVGPSMTKSSLKTKVQRVRSRGSNLFREASSRVLASKQSLMKTHFHETRSSSRKEDYTAPSIYSPPTLSLSRWNLNYFMNRINKILSGVLSSRRQKILLAAIR